MRPLVAFVALLLALAALTLAVDPHDGDKGHNDGAVQQTSDLPHDFRAYWWILIIYLTFVGVPFVVLWGLGWITLSCSIVPSNSPNRGRYFFRLRLTPEERQMAVTERVGTPLDPNNPDSEWIELARQWSRESREARRARNSQRLSAALGSVGIHRDSRSSHGQSSNASRRNRNRNSNGNNSASAASQRNSGISHSSGSRSSNNGGGQRGSWFSVFSGHSRGNSAFSQRVQMDDDLTIQEVDERSTHSSDRDPITGERSSGYDASAESLSQDIARDNMLEQARELVRDRLQQPRRHSL